MGRIQGHRGLMMLFFTRLFKHIHLDYSSFVNTDLETIVTPVDAAKLGELLKNANYCPIETQFLVKGFSTGFDIEYHGPKKRQSQADNIPFISVGSPVELWSKIMKEVKEGRYAGPFDAPPFQNFIQSPIGLVPKKGGKTRLIFHLSYNFGEGEPSVNASTPKELCHVKYDDLDVAVKLCLEAHQEAVASGGSTIFMGKTDAANAFRVLPLKRECICWLLMKARDPKDGRIKYFVEKCLPFGASISCSHYQRFSNALKFLLCHRTGQKAVANYLDDFLFLSYLKAVCNWMIEEFLKLCGKIGVPIAIEKTEWANTVLIFLGILLNGDKLCLSIPIEKQEKALKLLNNMLSSRKATIKELQSLTGYLNFLCRAIHPGRTFTRRMYAKAQGWEIAKNGKRLHQHHHVTIDGEFKFDCQIWTTFLTSYRDQSLCRPMMDLLSDNCLATAKQLSFFSDASKAKHLGYGTVFNNQWLFNQWEPDYIQEKDPSIEYLELYALVVAVITWENNLKTSGWRSTAIMNR